MLGFETDGMAVENVSAGTGVATVKACFRISDNKFLEAQSDPTPGTMIANAVRAGYDANDLEERDITDAEFLALIGAAQ